MVATASVISESASVVPVAVTVNAVPAVFDFIVTTPAEAEALTAVLTEAVAFTAAAILAAIVATVSPAAKVVSMLFEFITTLVTSFASTSPDVAIVTVLT